MFNDEAVALLEKVRARICGLADGKFPIRDEGVFEAVSEVDEMIAYYKQGPNDFKKEHDMYHN